MNPEPDIDHTSHPNPLQALSLADLRSRTSMKWRIYPPDVLPLWVAEMDVPLAEPVARAVVDAIARGDTGYPAGTDYAEAASQFAAQRWNWTGLSVERTAIVPDVMMGIVEVLRLITSPGDAIIVNTPAYPPFYSFVQHADRQVLEAALLPDHHLDFAALESAFIRATAHGSSAAYLLCNPHNPTGAVYTADELATVAGIAEKHHVRVVANEIHAPLTMPGVEFHPYLSVAGSSDAFSLFSASKGWNLAGLKAALLIAGEQALTDLRRLPEEVSHGPSHLGVIAHTSALRDGGEWLDALLAGLDQNRRLLSELLDQHLPTVTFRTPQGTYFAWLNCQALGLDDGTETGARGLITSTAGAASVFLERGRIALSAGPAFGTGGVGHVRLNMATSREILAEAVERMASAIA